MLKYIVALISVSLALWSGSEWINFRVFQLADVSQEPNRLLRQEELLLYTGTKDSKGLCLAILGQVFDVEKGRKHYGPGGGYRFFTGISPTLCVMTSPPGGVVTAQNKKTQGVELDLIQSLIYPEYSC